MDKRPFFERLCSIRFPVLLFVALQVLDVLSSMLSGKAALQQNPIMLSLLASHGIQGVMAAKAFVIATILLAVWADDMQRHHIRVTVQALDVTYATILGAKLWAYGQWSGDWSLPIVFLVSMLGVATTAAYTRFSSRAKATRAPN